MMEFLNKNSNMPQKASLILGFFDGIHIGHREVIKNCPNNKKILVTFSSSPAEFFNKNFEYTNSLCHMLSKHLIVFILLNFHNFV